MVMSSGDDERYKGSGEPLEEINRKESGILNEKDFPIQFFASNLCYGDVNTPSLWLTGGHVHSYVALKILSFDFPAFQAGILDESLKLELRLSLWRNVQERLSDDIFIPSPESLRGRQIELLFPVDSVLSATLPPLPPPTEEELASAAAANSVYGTTYYGTSGRGQVAEALAASRAANNHTKELPLSECILFIDLLDSQRGVMLAQTSVYLVFPHPESIHQPIIGEDGFIKSTRGADEPPKLALSYQNSTGSVVLPMQLTRQVTGLKKCILAVARQFHANGTQEFFGDNGVIDSELLSRLTEFPSVSLASVMLTSIKELSVADVEKLETTIYDESPTLASTTIGLVCDRDAIQVENMSTRAIRSQLNRSSTRAASAMTSLALSVAASNRVSNVCGCPVNQLEAGRRLSPLLRIVRILPWDLRDEIHSGVGSDNRFSQRAYVIVEDAEVNPDLLDLYARQPIIISVRPIQVQDQPGRSSLPSKENSTSQNHGNVVSIGTISNYKGHWQEQNEIEMSAHEADKVEGLEVSLSIFSASLISTSTSDFNVFETSDSHGTLNHPLSPQSGRNGMMTLDELGNPTQRFGSSTLSVMPKSGGAAGNVIPSRIMITEKRIGSGVYRAPRVATASRGPSVSLVVADNGITPPQSLGRRTGHSGLPQSGMRLLNQTMVVPIMTEALESSSPLSSSSLAALQRDSNALVVLEDDSPVDLGNDFDSNRLAIGEVTLRWRWEEPDKFVCPPERIIKSPFEGLADDIDALPSGEDSLAATFKDSSPPSSGKRSIRLGLADDAACFQAIELFFQCATWVCRSLGPDGEAALKLANLQNSQNSTMDSNTARIVLAESLHLLGVLLDRLLTFYQGRRCLTSLYERIAAYAIRGKCHSIVLQAVQLLTLEWIASDEGQTFIAMADNLPDASELGDGSCGGRYKTAGQFWQAVQASQDMNLVPFERISMCFEITRAIRTLLGTPTTVVENSFIEDGSSFGLDASTMCEMATELVRVFSAASLDLWLSFNPFIARRYTASQADQTALLQCVELLGYLSTVQLELILDVQSRQWQVLRTLITHLSGSDSLLPHCESLIKLLQTAYGISALLVTRPQEVSAKIKLASNLMGTGSDASGIPQSSIGSEFLLPPTVLLHNILDSLGQRIADLVNLTLRTLEAQRNMLGGDLASINVQEAMSAAEPPLNLLRHYLALFRSLIERCELMDDSRTKLTSAGESSREVRSNRYCAMLARTRLLISEALSELANAFELPILSQIRLNHQGWQGLTGLTEMLTSLQERDATFTVNASFNTGNSLPSIITPELQRQAEDSLHLLSRMLAELSADVEDSPARLFSIISPLLPKKPAPTRSQVASQTALAKAAAAAKIWRTTTSETVSVSTDLGIEGRAHGGKIYYTTTPSTPQSVPVLELVYPEPVETPLLPSERETRLISEASVPFVGSALLEMLDISPSWLASIHALANFGEWINSLHPVAEATPEMISHGGNSVGAQATTLPIIAPCLSVLRRVCLTLVSALLQGLIGEEALNGVFFGLPTLARFEECLRSYSEGSDVDRLPSIRRGLIRLLNVTIGTENDYFSVLANKIDSLRTQARQLEILEGMTVENIYESNLIIERLEMMLVEKLTPSLLLSSVVLSVSHAMSLSGQKVVVPAFQFSETVVDEYSPSLAAAALALNYVGTAREDAMHNEFPLTLTFASLVRPLESSVMSKNMNQRINEEIGQIWSTQKVGQGLKLVLVETISTQLRLVWDVLFSGKLGTDLISYGRVLVLAAHGDVNPLMTLYCQANGITDGGGMSGLRQSGGKFGSASLSPRIGGSTNNAKWSARPSENITAPSLAVATAWVQSRQAVAILRAHYLLSSLGVIATILRQASGHELLKHLRENVPMPSNNKQDGAAAVNGDELAATVAVYLYSPAYAVASIESLWKSLRHIYDVTSLPTNTTSTHGEDVSFSRLSLPPVVTLSLPVLQGQDLAPGLEVDGLSLPLVLPLDNQLATFALPTRLAFSKLFLLSLTVPFGLTSGEEMITGDEFLDLSGDLMLPRTLKEMLPLPPPTLKAEHHKQNKNGEVVDPKQLIERLRRLFFQWLERSLVDNDTKFAERMKKNRLAANVIGVGHGNSGGYNYLVQDLLQLAMAMAAKATSETQVALRKVENIISGNSTDENKDDNSLSPRAIAAMSAAARSELRLCLAIQHTFLACHEIAAVPLASDRSTRSRRSLDRMLVGGATTTLAFTQLLPLLDNMDAVTATHNTSTSFYYNPSLTRVSREADAAHEAAIALLSRLCTALDVLAERQVAEWVEFAEASPSTLATTPLSTRFSWTQATGRAPLAFLCVTRFLLLFRHTRHCGVLLSTSRTAANERRYAESVESEIRCLRQALSLLLGCGYWEMGAALTTFYSSSLPAFITPRVNSYSEQAAIPTVPASLLTRRVTKSGNFVGTNQQLSSSQSTGVGIAPSASSRFLSRPIGGNPFTGAALVIANSGSNTTGSGDRRSRPPPPPLPPGSPPSSSFSLIADESFDTEDVKVNPGEDGAVSNSARREALTLELKRIAEKFTEKLKLDSHLRFPTRYLAIRHLSLGQITPTATDSLDSPSILSQIHAYNWSNLHTALEVEARGVAGSGLEEGSEDLHGGCHCASPLSWYERWVVVRFDLSSTVLSTAHYQDGIGDGGFISDDLEHPSSFDFLTKQIEAAFPDASVLPSSCDLASLLDIASLSIPDQNSLSLTATQSLQYIQVFPAFSASAVHAAGNGELLEPPVPPETTTKDSEDDAYVWDKMEPKSSQLVPHSDSRNGTTPDDRPVRANIDNEWIDFLSLPQTLYVYAPTPISEASEDNAVKRYTLGFPDISLPINSLLSDPLLSTSSSEPMKPLPDDLRPLSPIAIHAANIAVHCGQQSFSLLDASLQILGQQMIWLTRAERIASMLRDLRPGDAGEGPGASSNGRARQGRAVLFYPDSLFYGLVGTLGSVLYAPSQQPVGIANAAFVLAREIELLEQRWQSTRKHAKRDYLRRLADSQAAAATAQQSLSNPGVPTFSTIAAVAMITKETDTIKEPDLNLLRAEFDMQEASTLRRINTLRQYVDRTNELLSRTIDCIRQYVEKLPMTTREQIETKELKRKLTLHLESHFAALDIGISL